MTITVLNVKHKKEGNTNGKDWNIWSYRIAEDTWVDSFDKLEKGETYEGEITKNINPNYNDNFKLFKTAMGELQKNTSDLQSIHDKLDYIIDHLKINDMPSQKTDDLRF